jgi:hypothetical protein
MAKAAATAIDNVRFITNLPVLPYPIDLVIYRLVEDRRDEPGDDASYHFPVT